MTRRRPSRGPDGDRPERVRTAVSSGGAAAASTTGATTGHDDRSDVGDHHSGRDDWRVADDRSGDHGRHGDRDHRSHDSDRDTDQHSKRHGDHDDTTANPTMTTTTELESRRIDARRIDASTTGRCPTDGPHVDTDADPREGPSHD